MTRVLVVASSPVLRAGLEAVLRASPELEVSGAAEFDGIGPEGADVIVGVLDRSVEAPPQEWLDAANTTGLVILADGGRVWAAEALRAGVRAVLPGNSSAQQILAAVEAAAAGLVVMAAEDLQELWATPRLSRTTEALTTREAEVLGMMAEGLSNKMIAYRLGISEHTVKFHVTAILNKLNAGTRTEAVTLGLRQGLILL